jgi:ADP-ribosyl-[dinitrogen reductase] hydrolase
MDPDKANGMLLGLAVGDALGTTLEFGPRHSLRDLYTEMTGGGMFRLNPGQWTDDTAMALAMAASLIERNAFDPFDVMIEWSEWYKDGKHSCTGRCFDIGYSTRKALDCFLADPVRLPAISPHSLGNGPLMRLAPVVLFSKTEEMAESLSYRQAALTHGEKAASASAAFGRLLFRLLSSDFDLSLIPAEIRHRKREEVVSSGFYEATLEAAYWAVSTTRSFEDAIIQAVNLGDDADTVGAVAGQLAGVIYGYSSIPPRWLNALAWKSELLATVESLVNRRL